jgi:molybdopterin-guanine dinucleotide biosynthesis protein B
MFDRTLAVDWSARSKPTPPTPTENAIWVGTAGNQRNEHYFRTRHECEQFLHDSLAGDEHILLGADFPLGYPDGFANLLDVNNWHDIWYIIHEHIADHADNTNNRFEVAAQLNTNVSRPGPFWGHPQQHSYKTLQPTKPQYPISGIREFRHTERNAPGRIQSPWKLLGAGSVGSQALTGIPLLYRLRQRFNCTVWPFEPPTGRIVITEIWPSLYYDHDGNGIKDQHQVRHTADWMHQTGLPDIPQTNEGWILGVNRNS